MVISRCGDAVTTVALAWLVLDLAGPAQLGLVLLCSGLPRVVTGPSAGWLLDRFPARLLLGWDNAARGGLVAVLPLLLHLGVLRIVHVYAVVLLCAALSAVTEVAEGTLVPRLVDDDELETANSLLSLNWELAYVVAPPVAGAVVGASGAGPVLVVDAVSFAVMSLLCFRLPALPAPGGRPGTGARFGVLFRLPAASLLTACAVGFLFLGGAVEVFYPVYAHEVLRSGPVAFGALLAATGIGGVCGVLFGLPLSRGLPPGARLAAAIVVGAPVFAVLACTRSAVVAVVLAGVASFLWAPYYALERSLFQRAVPDGVRGQVTGARTALCALGFPLGCAAGGLLPAGVGATAAGVLIAGGYLALGVLPLLGAATIRRSVEALPGRG